MTPSDLVSAFVAAFNSGSADAVDALYEDTGVVIPADGQPLSVPSRLSANGHLVSFGR